MIKTKKLVKILGERYILRGIDLHIQKGESVALLGANGAGKSTWLNIVAGLLKPTEGEVFMKGRRFEADDYKRQQLIGYLGHKSFLYDHLSPVENLMFYAKLYHVNNPQEKIDELLAAVGLTFFQHEPVHTFSRGMVQRLAIARTILHEPHILLLDEPYTGLDQQAIHLLNELLNEQREKKTTIVLITHDFEQIHRVCDRVVMLEQGKIATDEALAGRSVEWVKQRYNKERLA